MTKSLYTGKRLEKEMAMRRWKVVWQRKKPEEKKKEEEKERSVLRREKSRKEALES